MYDNQIYEGMCRDSMTTIPIPEKVRPFVPLTMVEMCLVVQLNFCHELHIRIDDELAWSLSVLAG